MASFSPSIAGPYIPSIPTIDPFGKLPPPPTEEEQAIATRAELENAAMLRRLQEDEARKAELENKRIADEAAAAEAANAPSDLGTYAGQGVRALAEGIASFGDLPERTYTGIKNVPTRLANIGLISPSVDSGPGGKAPLAEPFTPVANDFNEAWPPAPGWENSWTRAIGNVAAPIIVMAPLTGGAGVVGTGARAALVRPTVTAATGIGGSLAAGKLGEMIGNATDNPDLADALKTWGEVAGGLAGPEVPSAGMSAIYRGARRAWTNPTSAARLDAWLRQGGGDAISLGAIGNKAAQVREDATVGVPLAGNAAFNARRNQHGTLDRVALEAADAPRVAAGAAPVVPGAAERNLSPKAIGRAAINTAQQAKDAIQAIKDRIFGTGVSDVVGRATVLDPITQNQRLEALATSPLTDESQLPTIEQVQRGMARNSAGQIVNQALENTLQARRAAILANPNPDVIALEQVNSQIANNRGPTWQQQLKQRSLRRLAGTNVPLDAEMQAEIYAAQTDTLRQAAENAGIPAAEFDRINEETSRLTRQQRLLDDLAGKRRNEPPDTAAAHTRMFGTGGLRNEEQIAALQEHAPGALAQVFGDELERQLRGDEAAGTAEPNPETFNPKAARTYLTKIRQDPQLTDIVAPTVEDQQRLDDLATMLRGEAGRPTRTLPGAGGNTLGAPATLYQNPAFLTALGAMLTQGGSLGGPLAFLTALAPMARARTIANFFTNPGHVVRTVHPPAFIDLPRLLSGALVSPPAQGRDQVR